MKFNDNPSTERRVLPCGQTNSQAGRHDAAKSIFAILLTRSYFQRFTYYFL